MKHGRRSGTLVNPAAAAAATLAFAVGIAAGIVSFDGEPSVDLDFAALPGDLVPGAGIPDVDLGMVAIQDGAIELAAPVVPDAAAAVRPASEMAARTAPASLAAGAAVRATGAILEPGPRLTALTRGAPVAGSLGLDAEHAEEAQADKAALPLPETDIATVAVRPGDTLMNLLLRAGVDRMEAHRAVLALRPVYDPRRLRAGQALEIASRHDPEASHLVGFSFDISFDHEIRISRAADGSFTGAKVERPQQRRMVHRFAPIEDSLYLAADRQAVPHDVISDLIRLYSWDVDFQRELRRGDAFEVLYDEVSLADDGERRGGDLIFARLDLSGRSLEAYRFEHENGSVEFYDGTGRSLRKFLLRTPVDGARISSRFGMRRHPVLGYSKMHKGTDFAAPTGTPIYAAGSGRIERASRFGAYGKYIRIRHSGEYSTAYAHLSRYAKGIRRGARVTQGQVIGYVGSTGRSTGPHLHYEVLRHGAQINSQKLKHPPLTQLAGDDLQRFRTEMARIDQLRLDLQRETQVASKNGGSRTIR